MSIINKLNLTKFKNLTVLNQPEDYDCFMIAIQNFPAAMMRYSFL
jgi:hypothetical protein